MTRLSTTCACAPSFIRCWRSRASSPWAGTLAANVSQKLAEQNIATGFAFLGREAGFVISPTFIDYQADGQLRPRAPDRVCNTIFVSTLGHLRDDHRPDRRRRAALGQPALAFWRSCTSRLCGMFRCCCTCSSGTG